MTVLKPKKKGKVINCDSSIHIRQLHTCLFSQQSTLENHIALQQKTEEPHYATVKSEEDYCTVKSEAPYYSTVNIKRPDASIIELEKNNAYEIPPQLPQRIQVEENPAYASVNGQG